MTATTTQIKNLLHEAKGIAKHQEEISLLRGERFNIFSILKMESKENATHSAFLGELLDPKGTHGMGAVFLELFLKVVGYNGEAADKKAEKKFVAEGATVVLKFYLGPVCKEKKTGGEIDIYLKDKQGHVISIENKINARDQPAQVERYYKHKTAQNTVYYLTLWGHSASDASAGKLKAGEDYHTISYRDHVIDWLEACIKEAANQPILRESIRQYIVLLQKLTHQLSDKKMEKQVQDLISENYNAAKLVEANIYQTELRAAKAFLKEVKEVVAAALGDGWEFKITHDLSKDWAGIEIRFIKWHTSKQDDNLVITLQGQKKFVGGPSQYCIYAHESHWDRTAVLNAFEKDKGALEKFSSNEWCPFFRWINLFDSDEKKQRLFDDDERTKMVGWVSRDLIEMAKAAKEPLKLLSEKKISKV